MGKLENKICKSQSSIWPAIISDLQNPSTHKGFKIALGLLFSLTKDHLITKAAFQILTEFFVVVVVQFSNQLV